MCYRSNISLSHTWPTQSPPISRAKTSSEEHWHGGDPQPQSTGPCLLLPSRKQASSFSSESKPLATHSYMTWRPLIALHVGSLVAGPALLTAAPSACCSPDITAGETESRLQERGTIWGSSTPGCGDIHVPRTDNNTHR